MKDNNTTRDAELRDMLNTRKHELQDDLQSRIRGVRTDRENEVRDELEDSDARSHRDIELAMLQIKTETPRIISSSPASIPPGISEPEPTVGSRQTAS